MPRNKPLVPIVPELERKMDYAIRLADPEWQPEYEDLLKLIYLLREIEQLLSHGSTANPAVDIEFRKTVKAFFKVSGLFRREVELHLRVKQFIQCM